MDFHSNSLLPRYLFLIFFLGGLSFQVESETETDFCCDDNNDGSYTVSYVPEEAAEFDIHVTLQGKPIHESPYHVISMAEVEEEPMKEPLPVVQTKPKLKPKVVWKIRRTKIVLLH